MTKAAGLVELGLDVWISIPPSPTTLKLHGMKNRRLNQAYSLDAGIPTVFHVEHHRPAASDVVRSATGDGFLINNYD